MPRRMMLAARTARAVRTFHHPLLGQTHVASSWSVSLYRRHRESRGGKSRPRQLPQRGTRRGKRHGSCCWCCSCCCYFFAVPQHETTAVLRTGCPPWFLNAFYYWQLWWNRSSALQFDEKGSVFFYPKRFVHFLTGPTEFGDPQFHSCVLASSQVCEPDEPLRSQRNRTYIKVTSR
jgi:hypothetical protein